MLLHVRLAVFNISRVSAMKLLRVTGIFNSSKQKVPSHVAVLLFIGVDTTGQVWANSEFHTVRGRSPFQFLQSDHELGSYCCFLIVSIHFPLEAFESY